MKNPLTIVITNDSGATVRIDGQSSLAIQDIVITNDSAQTVEITDAATTEIHPIKVNILNLGNTNSSLAETSDTGTDVVTDYYDPLNVTGGGTTNYLPKYTDGVNGIVGNSQVVDDGTDVFITKSLHIGALTGAAGDNNLIVDGAIGIGGTAPTVPLDIYETSHTGYAVLIGYSTVAHGMTDLLPTTDWFQVLRASQGSTAAFGGAIVRGASNINYTPGLELDALCGVAPDNVYAAMKFMVAKKDGTSIQALGGSLYAYKWFDYDTELMSLAADGDLVITGDISAAGAKISSLSNTYAPYQFNGALVDSILFYTGNHGTFEYVEDSVFVTSKTTKTAGDSYCAFHLFNNWVSHSGLDSYFRLYGANYAGSIDSISYAYLTAIEAEASVMYKTGSSAGFFQYFLTNDLVRLTISDSGLSTPFTFTSTLATGTAPFVIASTTKVDNLNVDSVDGVNIGALTNTYVPVYDSTGTQLKNSQIIDTGTLIGLATSPTHFLTIGGTETAVSKYAVLVNRAFTYNATGSETNGVYGIYINDHFTTTASTNTTGTVALRGIRSRPVWDGTFTAISASSALIAVDVIGEFDAAGTLPFLYGINIGSIINNASAVVSVHRSINISSPTITSGSIGSNYGIFIDNQTAGTANYALYSAGAQSYHAGSLAIGTRTTTPESRLTVDSATAFSTSTTIGGQNTVLLTNNTTGAGVGNVGPNIGFGGPGTDGLRAAFGAIQTESDVDQIGFVWYTHPSATASDALVEGMRLDHLGNLTVVGTMQCAYEIVKSTGTEAFQDFYINNSGGTSTYVGSLKANWQNFPASYAAIDVSVYNGSGLDVYQRIGKHQSGLKYNEMIQPVHIGDNVTIDWGTYAGPDWQMKHDATSSPNWFIIDGLVNNQPIHLRTKLAYIKVTPYDTQEVARVGRYGVSIGGTEPVCPLDIYEMATTGYAMLIGYSTVAHGMTDLLPTTDWFQVLRSSQDTTAANGGAIIRGASNANTVPGLELNGLCGTEPTTNYSALKIMSAKKSGTGIAALGNTVLAAQFLNYTTALVSIYGNGDITSIAQVKGATGYFGGASHYSSFEADGTYLMTGNATVWDDLQFGISAGKVPAVNTPTFETFNTNSNEYSFAVNDYIDLGSGELPHPWKEQSDWQFHLHVTTKAANSSGANRFAKFTVYFSYANASGSVWTETSLTAELTIPDGTAALQTFKLTLGTFTPTGYTFGARIKPRVVRIAATGGTEYSGNIFIEQLGVHFEKDTVGSRTATAK